LKAGGGEASKRLISVYQNDKNILIAFLSSAFKPIVYIDSAEGPNSYMMKILNNIFLFADGAIEEYQLRSEIKEFFFKDDQAILVRLSQ
jgi:hypothetical protein